MRVHFVFSLLVSLFSIADPFHLNKPPQSLDKECNPRKYDQTSFVCVCNATYCDEVIPLGEFGDDEAVVYTSSLEMDRLRRTVLPFGDVEGDRLKVKLNVDKRYQKIIGFGGAITDSVMLVAGQTKLTDQLFDQYYGPSGIDYSLGRIPIGSTDFSDREWSYAEKDNDFELESFSMNQDIKVDFVRRIVETRPDIKLFASPWSSPGWMKDTGRMKGGGRLLGEMNGKYYKTYANYYLRFFQEYAKNGIKFWGVTVENEPGAGKIKDWWQALYFDPQMQRDFVQELLGPVLRGNELTKDIKIIVHDDQRDELLACAQQVFDNSSFIDGFGVHWYVHMSYEPLSDTHRMHPSKFILATEACNGDQKGEHKPLMGSWWYGERYAHDIIQNLRHYVEGWTDWNIWLDERGGPNWVNNFVDAPIIVNTTGSEEFYKQPMYYIMGHFSKFIRPDSVVVDVQIESLLGHEDEPLEAVAFKSPNNDLVLVLHNRQTSKPYRLALSDGQGRFLNIDLEPKSIKTIVWHSK